jgi:hypothetical protein
MRTEIHKSLQQCPLLNHLRGIRNVICCFLKEGHWGLSLLRSVEVS